MPDNTRAARRHHPNRPSQSGRTLAPFRSASSCVRHVGVERPEGGTAAMDTRSELPVGHSGNKNLLPPAPHTTTRIRRFHVYDSDGEVLSSFTDWDTAHAWAHEQATNPAVRAPLDVDDRVNRVTRRVRSGQCEFIAWETVAHLSIGCEHHR